MCCALAKARAQPGTRFCQANPGCHCGSGSAPQQHSRAQLAPQAQARPSAATPRRRARPARLPPRQLGARGARLAHPRALRGACPGALRIGARAGAAPLAQRGHHWPPRRPPSGAAANCSRCAAQGLRRAYTRALHKMWLIVQPGRSRIGQKQHIVVQCRYAAIAAPAGVRAPLPARGGCAASCPCCLPAAPARRKREDAGALPPLPPRSPLRQEGPILSAPPGLERMAPCRCVKGTLCPCEHILTRLTPGCGIPPTALDTPTRDRRDLNRTTSHPSRAETHPPRKTQTEQGR